MGNKKSDHRPPSLQKRSERKKFYFFLAVFADSLKALAVGAPLVPGFLIVSPEPAAIRAFLALIAAYNPGSPGFFIVLKVKIVVTPDGGLVADVRAGYIERKMLESILFCHAILYEAFYALAYGINKPTTLLVQSDNSVIEPIGNQKIVIRIRVQNCAKYV
jgi:hypothetical protein